MFDDLMYYFRKITVDGKDYYGRPNLYFEIDDVRLIIPNCMGDADAIKFHTHKLTEEQIKNLDRASIGGYFDKDGLTVNVLVLLHSYLYPQKDS